MSNYKNRRARGQCASCTDAAIPGEVRCQKCKDKHRKQYVEKSVDLNARRRERMFHRSIERERRLDEIDERLKQEIAMLEKGTV